VLLLFFVKRITGIEHMSKPGNLCFILARWQGHGHQELFFSRKIVISQENRRRLVAAGVTENIINFCRSVLQCRLKPLLFCK